MPKSPFDRGGFRFYLMWTVLCNAAISHLPLLDQAPRPVAALLRGHMSGFTVLLALPLVLLGTAIHLWAKGCLMQNREVTTVGPYRFVRHPFYLANGLVDMAICVMSGWWPLMLLLPFWWLAVYIPAMRDEEQHLISLFGDGYRDYMKALPRLIPFRRPLPANAEGFSWSNRNIAEGMEVTRACRLLAYPLTFYLWSQLWAHGREIFSDTHNLRLLALSGLITLYGLSFGFRQHLKRRELIMAPFLRRPATRVVVGMAIIGAALSLLVLDTEKDALLLPVGGLLALAAVLASLGRRSLVVLFSEGLTLAAVCVLCELPWLAAVPVLFYAALIMDTRLAAAEAAAAPSPSGEPLRIALPALPYVLMVVGILSAVMKQTFLD